VQVFSPGSIFWPLVAITNPTVNQTVVSFNQPQSGFAICI
jgi:hypothetical protein